MRMDVHAVAPLKQSMGGLADAIPAHEDLNRISGFTNPNHSQCAVIEPVLRVGATRKVDCTMSK
jgi:hypothetical protein